MQRIYKEDGMSDMKTLKELKKALPDKVRTSGNNYYIEGFGWYKQRRTAFGMMTYCKLDDNWGRISFDKLINELKQVWEF